MKKIGVKLMFVLSVFALSACNSTSNTIGNGKVEGVVEASNHFISTASDEAVTVVVPSSATSGTKVDITLTYDENEYQVDGVSVNTITPSKTGEKTFSFMMPDEDVTVTVTGNYVDPSHGKYAIINTNEDKGVVLVGAEKFVASEENVSFKVELDPSSAYSFTGNLTITDNLDQDVPFTLVAGVYSFVMPESSVTIVAEVEEKEFLVVVPSSETSYVSYSAVYIVEEDESITKVDYGYSSSISGYKLYVKAGSSVRVTVKDTTTDIVTGLKVVSANGNTSTYAAVSESSTKYTYFTMPSANVTLKPETTKNYKSINVVNTEHLTMTLKSKDGDDYVDVVDYEHFVPGDTVYIFVTSDDEDISVNKITVSCNNDASTATVTTVDSANGIYSFKMVNYDDVKITIAEKNVAAYKNYVFANVNHFGLEVYTTGARTSLSASSSYSLFINGAGEIKKGTSTSYGIISVSETSTYTKGLASIQSLSSSTASIYDFYYDENVIVAGWSLTSTFANGYGKDWLVSVHSLDDSDTLSNYSFEYYLESSKTFFALNAYRKVNEETTYYCSVFFDYTNKEVYSKGLTFELLNDTTTVVSTTANYNVVVDGVTIGTVNGSTYTKA
ncbi:MAG: hypothetical protein ACI31G_00990 [Bacilli bacterium]